MFERYTEQSRRVIFFARYEASMAGAPAIEPEHLLLGIAREDKPLCKRLLNLTNPFDDLRRRLEGHGGPRPKIAASVALPLGHESKRVLAFAHDESDRCGPRHHIGTEHLLAGLMRAAGTLAARVLAESGLTLEAVRENLSRQPAARDSTETNEPDAETFTEMAESWTYTEMAEPAEAVPHAQTASNMLDSLLFPMTSARIEHIGIATPNIDDALPFWRDALGLEVKHSEVVEEQGVRVVMLPVGEPRIELLEPTGEDSPVAKFLRKRGPGIHHIAVRVPDIRAALARLKEQGARLIDAEPRVGVDNCLVAFVHPQSAGGVLLELVEHQS